MFDLILAVLIALLPVVVLFSGMAMTPLLILFVLLTLLSVPKAALRAPAIQLPDYRKITMLLGLMLIWPLLTGIWSILPHHSFSVGLRAILLFVAGMTCFIYATAQKPLSVRMLDFCAAGIALCTTLLILEKLFTPGPIEYLYTLLHQNYYKFIVKDVNRGLCAWTVLIWPLILGFYRVHQPRRAWVAMVALAVGVMIMHSLSAKVGLVAGGIAFFLVRRFPTAIPRAVMVLFPLFILSFPLLYIAAEHTFFALSIVREHLTESGLHRLSIWHELLVKVAEKPWFGWGVDTTRAMPFSPEILARLHVTEPPLHPHSPSLQLLLEQGIIGLVLTASALFLLLREWVRIPQADTIKRATAGALIVSYFASGVSSFGIWQFWWIATLWIAGYLWRRMSVSVPSPVAV
jgi:O-antigen ligase